MGKNVKLVLLPATLIAVALVSFTPAAIRGPLAPCGTSLRFSLVFFGSVGADLIGLSSSRIAQQAMLTFVTALAFGVPGATLHFTRARFHVTLYVVLVLAWLGTFLWLYYWAYPTDCF